jgi:hypothetical protein
VHAIQSRNIVFVLLQVPVSGSVFVNRQREAADVYGSLGDRLGLGLLLRRGFGSLFQCTPDPFTTG